MTLPASMVDDVEDLAHSERSCCGFLTISTSVLGEVMSLDISTPNLEALPVISALAGIPLP